MGATKPPATRTPFDEFRGHINRLRKDIAAMIGEDKVDKFVRVCLNAVQYNPKLLAADRRSLFLSCLEAAQDGLLPDGSEAVLNIYPTKSKDERGKEIWTDVVQYLPMAYGLVQKIYEAGATRVDAVAVYKNDKFHYQRGDAPKIDHEPYSGDAEPGPVVAAYCIVEFPGLAPKREVMWRRDIEKVKEKSKAQAGLMWKDFYDQAAIKSVIHRINKQLPQSERLNRVLRSDNKAVGLADVAVAPDDSAGMNLEALIDGTFDQQSRTVQQGVPAGEKVVHGTDEAVTTGAKAEEKVVEGEKKPEPPKQGDKGTPTLKAKFLGQFDGAQAMDVLDIVMDDVRFYVWEQPDLDEMTAKYKAKAEALKAK